MTNRDEVELTKEELEFEKDFENGVYMPVENLEEEKKRFEQMVKQKRTRKKISIRIQERDLLFIKEKAEKL